MSTPSPLALDVPGGRLSDADPTTRRHPYAFLVANAALIGAVTFVASVALDRPVADPEGSFLGPSWVRLPVLCVAAIVLDLLPRALWRGRLHPGRTAAAARERVRTHWTRARLQLVVIGISGFYVVYVAYRNLKSLLPLVRDDKYDAELRLLDRVLLLATTRPHSCTTSSAPESRRTCCRRSTSPTSRSSRSSSPSGSCGRATSATAGGS